MGSSFITASRMASEIWSAILSGWPSVTDSEVNRNFSSLRVKTFSSSDLRARLRHGTFHSGKYKQANYHAANIESTICREASDSRVERRIGAVGTPKRLRKKPVNFDRLLQFQTFGP